MQNSGTKENGVLRRLFNTIVSRERALSTALQSRKTKQVSDSRSRSLPLW